MQPEIEQFQSWLTSQYPSSSTRIHYTSDLVLFFSWANLPPAGISVRVVDDFITHCQALGHARTTINRRLAALNTFYYFLAMCTDVPVESPVRHYLRKPHPLPRDASDTNVQSFLNAAPGSREKTMLLLMLECGLRVGEIHNLSLVDILWEAPPRLKVRGKGNKLRTVYLSPDAITALQDWLTHRPVTKDQAVFVSRRGKRLSIAGIQFIVRKIGEKTGKKITCHQFRHTFGRRMAEAGMSVTSLKSLMGHNSLRTTQVYVHLSNSHLQTEYEHAISSVMEALA